MIRGLELSPLGRREELKLNQSPATIDLVSYVCVFFLCLCIMTYGASIKKTQKDDVQRSTMLMACICQEGGTPQCLWGQKLLHSGPIHLMYFFI